MNNSNKEKKNRKTGIYFFSVSIHTVLIFLLTFPFLKIEQLDEDLLKGIYVQFDQLQDKESSKSARNKAIQKNSTKNAAETKVLKPKLEKSRDKIHPIEKEQKSTEKKEELTAKKVKTISRDEHQTLTEERRDFIVISKQKTEIDRQKALKEEQDRLAKLEEKARKEKSEKMKSAFSHLLKNATYETDIDHSGLELSHESLSTNEGKSNQGTTEDISNRQVIFIPEIKDKSQKEGRVVIKICVNSSGKVISAKYTQRGSTTTDSYLVNLALKNAKLYKFSTSPSPKQCGVVNIDFEVV